MIYDIYTIYTISNYLLIYNIYTISNYIPLDNISITSKISQKKKKCFQKLWNASTR
jgi:hypothetical protein